MEIVIFLLGFLCGAGLVFVIFNMVNKGSKSSTDKMFEQMQLYFENISNRLFKESSEEFSNQNKQKLEEFFSKFREKIEDFEKRTEQNFKYESENFTKFDVNIKSFIDAGSKISHDTNALVNVMKSDNRKQGHWGEIVLEKVLEASGLRNGDEYLLQKGFDEKRPDAVILLPENRCVYIDAKTSFASWDAYINSNSDEEKDFHLKSFKDSLKAHITGLAKKDYSSTGDLVSPDYVLMFLPIESCYSLVFCDDSQMWEFAWKNKIMPVSPSTLLASLKIINSFHVVERQNKNALEITRICTKMLDKFAEMLKDLLDARKKIIAALTRLNGKDNILTNIDKLRDLGAVINKDIPELTDDVLDEIETSKIVVPS